MEVNILMGGRAGQGINVVSKIVSDVLSSMGYYTFNYRDYQSLIRGGHSFNVLSASDTPIESHASQMDVIIAMDEKTAELHKFALKKDGVLIDSAEFRTEGRNLNIALAGKLIRILGVPLEILEESIKNQFKNNDSALVSARKGFESTKDKFSLKKLNNKITMMSGSDAVAEGARLAGLDLYLGYPMTPSTNALHAMAKDQLKKKMLVFQPEGEIAAVSMALGASFAGAKAMVGTSGGGFDLMVESLSMQGISNIPLTVYLASRAGPGTGVPTYTSQGDLDAALRSGHGEFPRVVVAPGNPTEVIEKTQEALYLAEKFKTLSIILSDKHLAESEFSSNEEPKKIKSFKISRDVPGKSIVKASSYESNEEGNTTESYVLTEKNANKRIENYQKIKEFVNKNFEMVKLHGKKDSKNLIIGWGSTSGVIKDAIKDMDAKFLQVLYIKPLSPIIKEEMEKADNVILVECNVTGQLGRLIREKTGIKIHNRLLKYNGRPFHIDELKHHLNDLLK